MALLERHSGAAACLLSLITSALLLRLRFGHWDHVPRKFAGTQAYLEGAFSWAAGGALPVHRSAPYTYLLGWCVRIGGDAYYAHVAVAMQLGMYGLTLTLVYWAARRVGGAGLYGFFAVALVAANGLFFNECVSPRESGLFALLMVMVGSALIFGALDSVRGAAALGMLVALVFLTRPTGNLLIVALTVMWWFERRRGRTAGRLVHLVTLLGVCAAILAIWAAGVRLNGSNFRIPGTFSSAFWSGNSAGTAAVYPRLDLDDLTPEANEIRKAARLEGKKPNDALTNTALEFIKENPGQVLSTLPVKAAALLVPIHFPLGRGRAVRSENGEWSVTDYRPYELRIHLLGVAALPGILGLFLALRWFRRIPGISMFTLCVLALVLCAHLVTFGETRYRVVFDPLLAIALAATWRTRAREVRPES